MLAPAPRPPSLAWRTGRTIGYWWAYRSPSPTPHDPDHYVRRLVSGLFVGVGVYVLFWPTVVLLLILAVSFGYSVLVVIPALILAIVAVETATT